MILHADQHLISNNIIESKSWILRYLRIGYMSTIRYLCDFIEPASVNMYIRSPVHMQCEVKILALPILKGTNYTYFVSIIPILRSRYYQDLQTNSIFVHRTKKNFLFNRRYLFIPILTEWELGSLPICWNDSLYRCTCNWT